MTRRQAQRRIVPDIRRVRLLDSGVVYERGGLMYPDCGHRPVDFEIVGFGFVGRDYLTAYGYHVAAPGRYLTRGIWPAADVAINEGDYPALDALIDNLRNLKEAKCANY